MNKTLRAMTIWLLKTYLLVNKSPDFCNRDILDITVTTLDQAIVVQKMQYILNINLTNS